MIIIVIISAIFISLSNQNRKFILWGSPLLAMFVWISFGGSKGPLSIAHVFVISVSRSFDGLPCCDKTASSKSWPSRQIAPIGLLVALAVRGFFNCSNAVLAFSALGLGPRFQSLFGWSWLRKEHKKSLPSSVFC